MKKVIVKARHDDFPYCSYATGPNNILIELTEEVRLAFVSEKWTERELLAGYYDEEIIELLKEEFFNGGWELSSQRIRELAGLRGRRKAYVYRGHVYNEFTLREAPGYMFEISFNFERDIEEGEEDFETFLRLKEELNGEEEEE